MVKPENKGNFNFDSNLQIHNSKHGHLMISWIKKENKESTSEENDSETLVKISRDVIPAGKILPGRPERIWSYLIPTETAEVGYKKRKKTRNSLINIQKIVFFL